MSSLRTSGARGTSARPPASAPRPEALAPLPPRGRRQGARARIAVGALLVGALSACGEAEDGLPRSLHELQRMAFVPAGSVALGGLTGSLATVGVPEPLLFDLFEVSRADWERYLDRPEDSDRWTAAGGAWTGEQPTWPAYMSHLEAVELARARGMRLPTAREWLYAAVGPAAHSYPWGIGVQRSVSNTLELGLYRPTAVGTFESGRSPFGCYDMVGNVWEWVADRAPGYGDDPELPSPAHPSEKGFAGGRLSALGGGYLSRLQPMYGRSYAGGRSSAVLAQTLDVRHRDPKVGMRCCVEAEAYLWEHAAEWGGGSEVRATLAAVGRRWGAHPAAAPFLTELAARPGAPEALSWLAEGARGP